MDNRLFREKARALRGVKIIESIPGKKRERVSVIGGLIDKKFIAPMVFTGGCNRDVFNVWLEKILIPELKPGTTIVMDNASFHKSSEMKKIIEESGCFFKFLPTYSPDLNPIEHLWHELKSLLRPIIQSGVSDMMQIVSDGLISMQTIRQN